MGQNADDGVEFRQATEDDLPAESYVFHAAEGELYKRHGFPLPEIPFDAFASPHRHLLANDGERCFVALAGGRVVGFTAAFARGETWFLSALFIDPKFQARGVGRRLLDRSWGGEYRRRITITDSIQPISNGLYAQRGLVPVTPILGLSGTVHCDAQSELEPSPPNAQAIASLDSQAYGFDRAVDHRYWSESATCTLWLRGGSPVAYSYVSREREVGPVAGRDAKSAGDALRAELARCDGKSAAVAIPGSARGLVEVALAAGLRFYAPPGMLLISPSVEAPRGLAISSYWLL